MPIAADKTQEISTSEVVKSPVDYTLLWLEESHINWKFGTSGSAWAELYPLSSDRTKILYRHPETGADMRIRVSIDNMVEYMERCPELAAVMGPYLAGIDAVNKLQIADRVKVEQDRLDAIAAEEVRLAQIETDRLAAEAERLVQIEEERIAAEKADKERRDREQADFDAYNAPEAIAARKAALVEAMQRSIETLQEQRDEKEKAKEVAEKEITDDVRKAVENVRLLQIAAAADAAAQEAFEAENRLKSAQAELDALLV